MPKASVLQSSFSSGEVSPLFYGQADNARYKKGLRSAQNFIATLQGPIIRRPGTKFCAVAKNSAAPTLIPFQFSDTQAYMLEFGDQYIRFFANNGQMVTVGNSYILKGSPDIFQSYTDPVRGLIGLFYATRANTNPQTDETGGVTLFIPVVSGTILELGSPYRLADLPQIQWKQSGDTLYLVHPSYPPYKLQRQAQTYWKLSPVEFKDGPYLALNTYSLLGDMSNFGLNVNSFSTTYPGAVEFKTSGISITGAVVDPGGSGQIKITTSAAHGLLTGQNVFISGVGGTTEANNWDALALPGAAQAYWTIQVTSTTTYLLLGSTFVHAYTAGGTQYPAIFAASAAAAKAGTMIPDAGRTLGFVVDGKRYFAYLSTSAALGGVVGPLNASHWWAVWPAATGVASTITGFYFGAYSAGSGFPRAISFHQNRLVLAGPGGAPQEMDGSEVGLYENFSPSDPLTLNVSDSNAYSFKLLSTDTNVIQWLASTAQGLISASYASEWCITPSSSNDALTPTNFNAQQTSYFGSAAVAPVQLGNSTFYIQRALRKIREMSFFFQAGTFRSIDLSELSEHITVPSITRLAVTKETQPLIWGLRSDGELISMIFNRDDMSLIAGWTPHVLGGVQDPSDRAAMVTSIASIPAPDLSFDQLWLSTKRYVNGSYVYYIEYMTKVFDDGITQEDAFQLDCGTTFYNPATITAITTANPAQITAHGLAAVFPGFSNGDHVRFEGIIGVSNHSGSLLNNQYFIVTGAVTTTVGAVTTTVFNITDYGGNPISSAGAGVGFYVSGGSVAKLVTTISGLTWLENTVVSILADGGIHPDVAVDGSGQISLQFPAAKVQIGYGFKSRGQLLRVDAGSPDGTSIGKTRRTSRLAVQLYRSGDLSLGTSFDNMIPVEFSQADVNMADQPMPLFSGMIREGLESAYDFESQACFEMSSALPGCIQSVTSFMEEFDV